MIMKLIKKVDSQGRKITYAITEKGRKLYEDELSRLRQCIIDAESEASR